MMKQTLSMVLAAGIVVAAGTALADFLADDRYETGFEDPPFAYGAREYIPDEPTDRWAVFAGCLPVTTAMAAPWSFEEAVEVTASRPGQFFHHIDSSGRRNIAVSAQGVAVAWEDDRDGMPRIYLAYKGFGETRFTRELRVSGDEEAYEPSLIALGGQRFALAWEEAGAVWLRIVGMDGRPEAGPPQRIGQGQGAQASLTHDDGRIILLWSEREGRYGRIRVRYVALDGLSPQPGAGCPVDASPPTDEQLYPAATVVNGKLVVVWEDRRPKHTVIMAATEVNSGACTFTRPARISEKPAGGNLPYGTGHGVSRVALERVGDAQAFAAWADKRNFRNGYDIWGAHYRADTASFGVNEPVQDEFGGLSKQRHAAVAGHPDGFPVVAWDDEREGNADLMLSWYNADGWSDDWPLPVASGEGWQSSPTLVLDGDGNLHVAWIERDAPGGTTKLKYALGRYEPE